MNTPLKIAIAGLGTVGSGTLQLLQANADLIAARCGRPVRVTAVADQVKNKDRGVSFDGISWYDDAEAMVANADADVVVELIGGAHGVAKRIVEAALARKRHVVTANKAMLAHHGLALAQVAESGGVTLAYEAAVAGGIPIIKAMREGLVANRISRVSGILNGTCNYILSTMRATGRDFGDVLREAQELGYAEADPAFDIDGVDAAHKLAILAAVAFGTRVDFGAVSVEGIRNVTATDIQYADEFGYRIKLLGIAECADGTMSLRVSPCLITPDMPLAAVDGVFNAIVAEGDFVGRSVYEGRGAGARPTASAVVADIADIAMGRRVPTFGVPVAALRQLAVRPLDARVGASYVRLAVVDRPGVFADIATAFRDESVSMESVLQRGRNANANVNVVIVTHESEDAALIRALQRLQNNAAVIEPPHMMRIETLQ
ncbi:MAG: homoserine dehydrogenase [Rhodospirillaceae bacterium]|nr:MAG: homoserine dehydrogenase [Rhodospirillaceae bacterium]